MAVRFKVLGVVEAWADGVSVDVGHARQRQVLGALLVDVDRVVPTDVLVERVWGELMLRRGRGALYGYVSRLRQALTSVGVDIVREQGGYRLVVEAEAVDLYQFRGLADQAKGAGAEERAVALWEEALGLWRGEAFAGADTPWFNAQRALLDAERLAAQLDLAEVRLQLGQHPRILAECSARAEAYPLDERVAGQFMLALYRCGRQAEALECYERVRHGLAEEMGVDPGQALQHLHQQILTADTALAAPTDTVALTEPISTVVPRQLPASPPVFAGRSQELEQLTDALDNRTGRSTAVVISAFGGVGKSWLAVRWAHENLGRFPDGQLYVNLRGFAPSAEPLPASVAVCGFLDALGVAPDAIPKDPQAQSGLYRSLLADRRTLIVLDDAYDADQVRPLLPGSPSCAVLVTSRNRLTALVTTHGASPLMLDVFQEAEARELLTRHLGVHRVVAEPEAVAALLEYCAGLPLALGIVAARAATHPALPLAVLAQELGEAANRLDALDAGDMTVNLRAVFSTSHRALTPPARRLFLLLGLAPGPDISLAAAASLAALAPARARVLLAELESAHLIQQHRPGRYQMHDLVRLFATELSCPEQDTAAALTRLVDFYLHTAFIANQLFDGPHTPFQPELASPAPGCTPLPLADAAAALEWFTTEHRCLLTAQSLALAQGWHAQVWQLAWTLISYHLSGHHLRDYFAVWRTALTSAEKDGATPAPEALAHWRLGHAHAQTGEHAKALAHLHRALTLSEKTGDIAAQAHICRTLGRAWEQHGDDQRALDHAIRALHLYQRLDNPIWQANQLNAVGWMHAQLGLYPEARTHCEQALALFRTYGRPGDEASTLDSLGYIAHHTGHHTHALDHYQQALAFFRDFGNTHDEADTLANLGDTHHAMNHPDQAREAWQQALALYETQHRTAQIQRLKNRLALRPTSWK